MSPAPKITFADLVTVLADDADVSKRTAAAFLHELISVVSGNVNDGERTTIPGLGYFDRNWRKASVSRDFRTGDPIEVPGHYYPVFKAVAPLRRLINREYAGQKFKPLLTAPVPGDQGTGKLPVQGDIPKAKSKPVKNTRKRNRLWLVPIFIILAAWLGFHYYSHFALSGMAGNLEISSNITAPSGTEADHRTEPSTVSGRTRVGISDETKASSEVKEERHDILKKDNLWRISDYFYGSPYLWPNIYRGNYTKLKTPDLILIGDVIVIPALEGKLGTLTQGDLTDISAGYLLVYFDYLKAAKSDARDYLWVASRLMNLTDSDRASDINPDDLRIISTIKGEVRFK